MSKIHFNISLNEFKKNHSKKKHQILFRSRKCKHYYKVENLFRFLLAEKNVWNAAINVLMRNYNLNIVNQNVGVLTTEWDSFYLKNEVYRNKISVRVRRSSYGIVDVTIHNNVEKLRDASQAAGTIGAVWLPAKDEAKEISRLLQNMALVLNQPPPIFPPGMDVAKGLSDGKEITR